MERWKKKILLLLMGGVALGFCYSPFQQRRVFRVICREWKKLTPKQLQKIRADISDLCRYEFLEKKENKGGSFKLFLTEKGKWRALDYRLENLKNKKKKWDGKWRMLAFDVPEKYKRGRDALRRKLKKIGFCELQKSVFVTPYDCKKEIGELVDFFNLNKYVRFGVLEYVDNEGHLRKFFNLV